MAAQLSSQAPRQSTVQKKLNLVQQISLTLLGFGVLVRFVQFFSNRSLWFDEVSLVLNLQDRSYPELLTRLDYNQAAPPLFLWLEKLLMETFGSHEYVLRFIPFLASLASLYLFYRLAQRSNEGLVMPIAIALFVASEYVVYYSAEVKPYSLDVALGLLLFWMLISLQGVVLNWRSRLQLILIGGISIWLSYPIVFILASTELLNLARSPRSKLKATLLNRLPIYAVWIVSFSILFLTVIQQTLGNDVLVDSWGDRYPESLGDIGWIADTIGRFFYDPMGFFGYADIVALLVFGAGCVCLYRRDRWRLAILGTPILLTFVAAYFQHYPFRERLILFLVPYAVLILSEGIVALLRLGRSRTMIVPALGVIMAALLLVPPFNRSIQRVTDPELFFYDHVRPVVNYIHDHWQEGDRLYVFREAKRQFVFYGAKAGFQPEDYVLGSQDLPELDEWSGEQLKKYHQDVEAFLGQPRVWFLLARKPDADQAALLVDLSYLGRQLDTYTHPGALGCLYDLRQETP